ncbi:MAG TPA: FtsX-like permease family protein [Vicinamibacterales bacterium]
MKYVRLLRVNLFRKKIRTLLTIGSFAVAMFLFGLLIIIRLAFNQGVAVAGADRLIVTNRMSLIQPLPLSYDSRLSAISGVKQVTHVSWFGGVYQDEHNFFPQFVIDVDTWRQVYGEYQISPGEWKAFVGDKQGVMVGRALADRFGWKVGDRIPIRGTIYPGTWEFNLRGIYDGSRDTADTSQFWIHYDYINESQSARFARNYVGWYVVKVASPDDSIHLAKTIDATFANSPWETKTDTEKAFAAGFAKQIGNIELLILSVGGVVFFTLLLVTGNTMAISVRERTGELAVLRAIGYSPRFVLLFVMAESIVIALVGGALGLMLAKGMTMGGDPTHGLLPMFYLPPQQMAFGLVLALVVGVLAGVLPAFSASRLKVVDALRRI